MNIIDKLVEVKEQIQDYSVKMLIDKLIVWFHSASLPIKPGIWLNNEPQEDNLNLLNSIFYIPCTEDMIIIQGKERHNNRSITLPNIGLTIFFSKKMEYTNYQVIKPIVYKQTSNTTDMRVLNINQFIEDNGYDIILSDDEIMNLIKDFGTKYTEVMITEYGNWRLNNPKRASMHKSHYRALKSTWVINNANINRLPNPNDEMIELRPNVMITAIEKKDLLKLIEVKLHEKNEHNQMEYLMEIATTLSSHKKKNFNYYTDQDANMIVSRIELLEKYKFNKN